MDAGLLAIVEADEAARLEVDAAHRRAQERVERERSRIREAAAAADVRQRGEHEAALKAISEQAQREAVERRQARDVRREARRAAAAEVQSIAVEAYLAIIRREESRR